jgi:hypothetical protein
MEPLLRDEEEEHGDDGQTPFAKTATLVNQETAVLPKKIMMTTTH